MRVCFLEARLLISIFHLSQSIVLDYMFVYLVFVAFVLFGGKENIFLQVTLGAGGFARRYVFLACEVAMQTFGQASFMMDCVYVFNRCLSQTGKRGRTQVTWRHTEHCSCVC